MKQDHSSIMVNRLKRSFKTSGKARKQSDNFVTRKTGRTPVSGENRHSVTKESQVSPGGQYNSVQMVTIDPDDAGQRIDNYLLRILKGVPKTRIYRILRKGEVRINKKRVTADYRIQGGDLLRIPPVRMAERGRKSKACQWCH